MENGIKYEKIHTDICVVGGGMAGVCAAISAARHGAEVVLMQERPVLGGNASSECRVHITGADRSGRIPNMRETGILESVHLESLRRNRNENHLVWDMLLYERVRFQPGLTLMLNCTCVEAEMDGAQIKSVVGWQLTTEKRITVEADIFVDCSGDGILAPLTGAEFRMGREGRDEFGESIAPEKADNKTMGMTCLFQAREYDTPQKFEPPAWAYKFENEDIPYGPRDHYWMETGYWWIELGGEHHSIYDTETLRDELLKITLGVWDHIKNGGDHAADNWALDWIQFLPAKRESRRYIGDYILTQHDVESGGRFDDIVAYGGWEMDDHDPAGFYAAKMGRPATIFHKGASPYGIPLRSLCSKNIDNLMFAGRCASATHAAMSSTRVMGTACTMGEAAGVSASVAIREGITPREAGRRFISEIQQKLLSDDCYLPWVKKEMSAITTDAMLTASNGDPEPVRDGIGRPVGDDPHCWECKPGDTLTYTFKSPQDVREATFITDTRMEKSILMSRHYPRDNRLTSLPETIAKDFRLEGLVDGEWREIANVQGNYQRFVRIPIEEKLEGVRLTIDSTWGSETTRVFGFYID